LITNPLCGVQILTERLVTRERWPQATLSDRAPIRAKLAEALNLLDGSLIDRQRGLVRNAIAFLGPTYPVTFRQILATVGLEGVSSDQLGKLASSLATDLPVLASFDASGPPDIIASSLLEKTKLDPRVVEGIAALLRQTMGSGSTAIVGIEEYREPWELETPTEAS